MLGMGGGWLGWREASSLIVVLLRQPKLNQQTPRAAPPVLNQARQSLPCQLALSTRTPPEATMAAKAPAMTAKGPSREAGAVIRQELNTLQSQSG
jgi:hypothetical protein